MRRRGGPRPLSGWIAIVNGTVTVNDGLSHLLNCGAPLFDFAFLAHLVAEKHSDEVALYSTCPVHTAAILIVAQFFGLVVRTAVRRKFRKFGVVRFVWKVFVARPAG